MKININKNLLGSLSIITSNELFEVTEKYISDKIFTKKIICIKCRKRSR